MRIELTLSAWEADVLPLNYICANKERFLLVLQLSLLYSSQNQYANGFPLKLDNKNWIIAWFRFNGVSLSILLMIRMYSSQQYPRYLKRHLHKTQVHGLPKALFP